MRGRVIGEVICKEVFSPRRPYERSGDRCDIGPGRLRPTRVSCVCDFCATPRGRRGCQAGLACRRRGRIRSGRGCRTGASRKCDSLRYARERSRPIAGRRWLGRCASGVGCHLCQSRRLRGMRERTRRSGRVAVRSAMVARVSSTSRQSGRGGLAFRVGAFPGLGALEVVLLDGVGIGASLVADRAAFDHDLARRVWAALRARASLRSRCSACAALYPA